jgi:hypothetical protein
MKKFIVAAVLTLSGFVVTGQTTDSSYWEFSADANFYIMQDDFFVLPVFRADKNKLHLEARYNYEDIETFSGWIGYNFKGGDDVFSYVFTPMIGGVFGLSNGIAPGLEFTLTYKNFELYSEMENLFDLSDKENNFYYNWADLTYSPTDWLWVGISGQRTRLYQTDLEIQRGIILGAGFKNIELTTYTYNIGFDDPFFIITLSANF